jgi:hypothetical protein
MFSNNSINGTIVILKERESTIFSKMFKIFPGNNANCKQNPGTTMTKINTNRLKVKSNI